MLTSSMLTACRPGSVSNCFFRLRSGARWRVPPFNTQTPFHRCLPALLEIPPEEVIVQPGRRRKHDRSPPCLRDKRQLFRSRLRTLRRRSAHWRVWGASDTSHYLWRLHFNKETCWLMHWLLFITHKCQHWNPGYFIIFIKDVQNRHGSLLTTTSPISYKLLILKIHIYCPSSPITCCDLPAYFEIYESKRYKLNHSKFVFAKMLKCFMCEVYFLIISAMKIAVVDFQKYGKPDYCWIYFSNSLLSKCKPSWSWNNMFYIHLVIYLYIMLSFLV